METMETQFENIVVAQIGAARVIGLNRPRKLNALCAPLFVELNRALAQAESDDAARVVVVIGGAGAGEKAFAAGADIAEMAQIESFAEAARRDCAGELWEQITRCGKPVVAAVGGLALGGGCELAMMCDIVIAAEDAKFGHPEIALGTMPGAGGAQRLARAIGKAKTMDMCLTGRTLDAAEAERAGLVARVVPRARLRAEALAAAEKIGSFSMPVARMIKESINRAFETTLREGVLFDRRRFHSTFALADRKEGMDAFLQKRAPVFRDC